MIHIENDSTGRYPWFLADENGEALALTAAAVVTMAEEAPGSRCSWETLRELVSDLEAAGFTVDGDVVRRGSAL